MEDIKKIMEELYNLYDNYKYEKVLELIKQYKRQFIVPRKDVKNDIPIYQFFTPSDEIAFDYITNKKELYISGPDHEFELLALKRDALVELKKYKEAIDVCRKEILPISPYNNETLAILYECTTLLGNRKESKMVLDEIMPYIWEADAFVKILFSQKNTVVFEKEGQGFYNLTLWAGKYMDEHTAWLLKKDAWAIYDPNTLLSPYDASLEKFFQEKGIVYRPSKKGLELAKQIYISAIDEDYEMSQIGIDKARENLIYMMEGDTSLADEIDEIYKD